MDDLTYQIKNLEFHLRQTAINHDKCISKAIKKFLDSDSEFSILVKPCEELKENLDVLVRKYEELTNSKINN